MGLKRLSEGMMGGWEERNLFDVSSMGSVWGGEWGGECWSSVCSWGGECWGSVWGRVCYSWGGSVCSNWGGVDGWGGVCYGWGGVSYSWGNWDWNMTGSVDNGLNNWVNWVWFLDDDWSRWDYVWGGLNDLFVWDWEIPEDWFGLRDEVGLLDDVQLGWGDLGLGQENWRQDSAWGGGGHGEQSTQQYLRTDKKIDGFMSEFQNKKCYKNFASKYSRRHKKYQATLGGIGNTEKNNC